MQLWLGYLTPQQSSNRLEVAYQKLLGMSRNVDLCVQSSQTATVTTSITIQASNRNCGTSGSQSSHIKYLIVSKGHGFRTRAQSFLFCNWQLDTGVCLFSIFPFLFPCGFKTAKCQMDMQSPTRRCTPCCCDSTHGVARQLADCVPSTGDHVAIQYSRR